MRNLIGLYRQIRCSFTGKVPDGSLVLRYVIRPVSHVASVPFVVWGWSPNATTALRALFGLAAVVTLAQPQWFWWRVGSLLLTVHVVMDMVDGNVARFRNQASYYGKFIDGLVDMLVYALMFVAAGIGLARAQGGIAWVIAGALIGLAVLSADYAVARLGLTQRWIALDQIAMGKSPAASLNQRPQSLSSRGYQFLISLSTDVLYVGLWLLLFVDARAVVIAVAGAMFLVQSLWLIASTFQVAAQTLNVHRLSKNALGDEKKSSVQEAVGAEVAP